MTDGSASFKDQGCRIAACAWHSRRLRMDLSRSNSDNPKAVENRLQSIRPDWEGEEERKWLMHELLFMSCWRPFIFKWPEQGPSQAVASLLVWSSQQGSQEGLYKDDAKAPTNEMGLLHPALVDAKGCACVKGNHHCRSEGPAAQRVWHVQYWFRICDVLWHCKPKCLGEGFENREFQTSGQERVQTVFWAQGTKVYQESLAPSETLMCTGATPNLYRCMRLFAPLAHKTFCTLSSPLVGNIQFSTPLPGTLISTLTHLGTLLRCLGRHMS